MNKKIIAANFKMNKTHKEIRDYLDIFLKKLDKEDFKNKNLNLLDTEIVFAPPYTSLLEAYNKIRLNYYDDLVRLASQNIYYEKSGAYTGEISIEMIKSCGCSYAIIGHSERRRIFNETDDLIAKKISSIFDDGKIIPILCVGENLNVRKEQKEYDFVSNQLNTALNSLKNKKIPSLIVAYEPIWAIGAGAPIGPEDGEKMHAFIYKYLNDNFIIEELRVIYGGSVTQSNIKMLITNKHIDGVLVGGASLDPSSFYNIYKFSLQY